MLSTHSARDGNALGEVLLEGEDRRKECLDGEGERRATAATTNNAASSEELEVDARGGERELEGLLSRDGLDALLPPPPLLLLPPLLPQSGDPGRPGLPQLALERLGAGGVQRRRCVLLREGEQSTRIDPWDGNLEREAAQREALARRRTRTKREQKENEENNKNEGCL